MNSSRTFGQQSEASPIEDYYAFSVSNKFNVSASVTNAYSQKGDFINDFTIALFSGNPPAQTTFSSLAADNPIATQTSADTFDPSFPLGSEGAKIRALGQAAGNYFLKVTGSASGFPSYGGSVSLVITTVPLPASAPMFGAALVALGAVGYGVKRKGRAAASA